MIEREVLEREKNLEKKINRLKGLIQSKERQLKNVENVLSTLTEQELILIEMKYFKRYLINRSCELLDITTATFIKRHKKIIVQTLIPLFYDKVTMLLS